MASSINASTTAGVVTTADTSGVLNIQTAGTTAISIDASQAVSFTNAPTVTGGTANGVAYLNGSKVLTTGSALVFDGSNLGVGTSSPYSAADARSIHLSASLYPLLEFSATSAPSNEKNWRFIARGISSTGVFQLQSLSDDNASETNVWEVKRSTGRSIEYQRFFTGAASEAMRLDSSGNLLVGTTTGASSTSALMQLKKGGVQWDTGPNGSNGGFNVLKDGTTGVYLTSGATSWSGLSDETMKDIIEPIENASQKISTLRTVIGKYKTDEEGTRRSFLIAQDVQAVLPEAVNENENGKLGLQYTDVMPLLVAAIKEQQALITQLQADVAALKGA